MKTFPLNLTSDEPGQRSAELLIHDVIGEDLFGGVSSKSVVENLQNLGQLDEITVRINSPGGSVFDGVAIYNAIKESKARVVVEIDGVAASAASFIAMAGDEINIAENAFMMIHQAQGLVVGSEAEMRKTANVLDKMDEMISGIYAARTGRRSETFMNMMRDETWFNAEEAVKNRLAGKIRENKGPSNIGNFGNAWRIISKRPERIAAMIPVGEPTELESEPAQVDVVAACPRHIDAILFEYQARVDALEFNA